MASSIDFVGKACPYCGATDALDIDDARGEVACTECAVVVAMGLEENALTRFEKDATMLDVDHGKKGEANDVAGHAMTLAQSNMLTRTEAAALAAGIVGPVKQEKRQYDKYMKTHLPPSMVRFMEDLVAFSRRSNGPLIVRKAIELAKLFRGRRKELGIETTGDRETAAACVVIAAGLNRQPIPSAELHTLTQTLSHAEERRQAVLVETQVSEDDQRRLREQFTPDLIRHYIRLLSLQLDRYEPACLVLARVLKTISSTHRTLENLSEAERCAAAVLLARTEPTLTWSSKPTYEAQAEPPRTTIYDGFGASAHLDAARVRAVMKTALAALPDVIAAFTAAMAQSTTVKVEPVEEVAGKKRPRAS